MSQSVERSSNRVSKSVKKKQAEESVPSVSTRTVVIHLVSKPFMKDCAFWVGLFQKGSLTPQQVMEVNDSTQILEKASREGLLEDQPIMMTDSQVSPARFYYLLPTPLRHIQRDGDWLSELSKTVEAWRPMRAGVYLSHELVSGETVPTLLYEMVDSLLAGKTVAEVYLQTSTHGMHLLLNVALAIKEELVSQGVVVHVFH